MVTRIQSPRTKRLRHKRKRRNRFTWTAIVLCGILLYGVASFTGSLSDTEPELSSGRTVQVYNMDTEQLMTLDLEQYLTGVVAAEMPASFSEEALKAQAVAARTFTVSRMEHPSPNVTALDSRAQLSTSPETCQAWISAEEQERRWGKQYKAYHRKIVQAVAETAGEVLRYDGTLIEPLYHASCGGGRTEDAAEVWGNARPYLVSVECNHPADPHTGQKVTMTLQDMTQRLGVTGAVPAGSFGDFMQLVASTASNRVKTLRVGGQEFSGAALRSALGLKSSLISWTVSGDKITFTTNGYGHGVGLCQYGANYYAEQGDSYAQILARYYPETQLSKE